MRDADHKQKRTGLFRSVERQERAELVRDLERMLLEEQTADTHYAVTTHDVSPYPTIPLFVSNRLSNT